MKPPGGGGSADASDSPVADNRSAGPDGDPCAAPLRSPPGISAKPRGNVAPDGFVIEFSTRRPIATNVGEATTDGSAGVGSREADDALPDALRLVHVDDVPGAQQDFDLALRGGGAAARSPPRGALASAASIAARCSRNIGSVTSVSGLIAAPPNRPSHRLPHELTGTCLGGQASDRPSLCPGPAGRPE